MKSHPRNWPWSIIKNFPLSLKYYTDRTCKFISMMTLLPTGANRGLQLRGFRFFTPSVVSLAIPVLPLPHCSVQFQRGFFRQPRGVQL